MDFSTNLGAKHSNSKLLRASDKLVACICNDESAENTRFYVAI